MAHRARAKVDWRRAPISIYEVHPGSWRRAPTATVPQSWDELAERLIPYVVGHGLHPYRAAADFRASL
jgi:1,4-alpha-glucan branching enzyme